MSYNPSSLLRLYIISANTELDSWGPLTNTNLTRIEESIHGQVPLSITGLDITLNDTVYTSTQAHKHLLILTGNQIDDCIITVPSRDHTFFVWNKTDPQAGTGPWTVSIKTSGQAAGVVALIHGERAVVVVNGGVATAFLRSTDFISADGNVSMKNDLNMGGHIVHNAGDPVNNGDLVTKAYLDSFLQNKYPIGSLYLNATNPNNPSTLLGFGSWIPYGTGRVMMSAGAFTDSRGEYRAFAASENSGGTYQHIISFNEMTRHNHFISSGFPTSLGGWSSGGSPNDVAHNLNGSRLTDDSGWSWPHNNMQPTFSVWIWVRTA